MKGLPCKRKRQHRDQNGNEHRRWSQKKFWKENQRLRWMKQKRSSEANIKIDSCQELNHLFNQLSSSSWVEISSSRTLHQLPLNVSECSLGLVLPHFCSASSKNSVLQSHNQQLLVIHYNSKIHENLTNRGINSQNVGSD